MAPIGSVEAAPSAETERPKKPKKPKLERRDSVMLRAAKLGTGWRPWKKREKEEAPSGGMMDGEASAQLIASIMSTEIADVVHAAAEAAADFAHAAGMAEDKCMNMYNAAISASAHVLDPTAPPLETAAATMGEDGKMVTGASRIEAILARSIKKNAVRVVDLFKEWDEDRNGVLSKKEFRSALKGAGIGASSSEIDSLFERWDKDGSGTIDFNELNKALKKGIANLKEELAGGAPGEDGEDTVTLLGRGKAAAAQEQKKAKKEAKERREALSPRSQQLKEAAEAAEKQRMKQLEKGWREDEETGRRWTASKWLASRQVSSVVAAALKLPPMSADSTSQFAYVKKLTREQVEQLLGAANMSGMVDFVYSSIETLSAQKEGSAEQLNDKFSTTAKFQMTYGSLSLFYGGLESLLGPPKMYKGPQHEEKSLFNTMEFEHTADKDARTEFKAPNGVATKSETEWQVVVAPEKGAEYPERLGYKENHPTWCRVPMTIEQMMDQMEEKCNSKLRLSGHSEMILEEMIGGRLYTGPMYIKYNTVLRSKTSDAAMLKLHKDLNKNNGYPTTIHAINSCVIKMSKLTKAGKVWRGIKDAALPKEFWVPNDMGVRGGIEYGFSSTTTDKEQALLYAGGEQSDASTIFEMQMGMVDRGANLTWLSQYPHEQEVLLPPLTGIEALNVEVDGSMLVIHSRLSLNLASHTLEQVLSRRRKMLMDMVSGIELELRDNLGEELTGYGIAVLQRALAYGPLSKDPEWFNDDENFAYVMQQTLQLQHAVVTQIKKLHVDVPELNLKGWKLGGSARILLLAGWCNQRCASSSSSGQMHETLAIDLRDSHLTQSEAEQLAELMTAQPRLTALDVRGNETMGLEGAEALATFIESNKGIGVTARSVLGVTPNSSSLEVPRTIEPVVRRLYCAELRTFVFAEGVSAAMGAGPKRDKSTVTLNRRGAFAANDWQPLLWASKENHVEIATMLLYLGMDINEQQPVTSSSSKFSALHVAAQKGNEEMVKLLLAKGIDKTLRDKHNNTALMLAEKKKHTEIIVLLGGDPDGRFGGGPTVRA